MALRSHGTPPTEDEWPKVTSSVLSEVRTVCKRARTALNFLRAVRLNEQKGEGGWVVEPWVPIYGTDPATGRRTYEGRTPGVRAPHPDLQQMIEALSDLVGRLEKYDR